MARPSPAISAVIPCLDEEANVRGVAAELGAALGALGGAYEIVVVDDGSRDRTAAIVDQLAAADARIRLVRHGENRGYGSALRSGFAAARHEWVFFADGDGQYDPGDLARLVARTGEAAIVVGRRDVRCDPWHRLLLTAGWNRLVRLVLGLRGVRDVNCAFKLFPRRLVDELGLESTGAMLHAELLVKAQRRGLRVVEVAVRHRPRRAGTPTGGSPRVMGRAVRELVRAWWAWRMPGARTAAPAIVARERSARG